MRAVRFERYGAPEVLDVVEVEPPVLGAGELEGRHALGMIVLVP